MKDYADIANTTGAFPNVESQNATGPGETDGTPIIKDVIDDLWGARQALMDAAGLYPNDISESVGNSQFLDALDFIAKKRVSDLQIRNWERNASAHSGDSLRDVCYGFCWVGVGRNTGYTLQYSLFGKVWTAVTNPTATPLNAVAYANGIYVAGGDAGKLIYASTPWGTWTNISANIDTGGAGITSITYGGGKWVITTNWGYIYTAVNPTGAWTQRATPASIANVSLECVRYISGLNLYVATGRKWLGGSDPLFSGIVTASDPDGTWTERVNPSIVSDYFLDISYDGIYIILTGGQTDVTLVRSLDGITYEDKTSIFDAISGIRAAIADRYGHIIAQSAYTAYLSEDSGNTWTTIDRDLDGSHIFYAGFVQAYRSGRIVFVGEDDVLRTTAI
jgi:hypothetical protein